MIRKAFSALLMMTLLTACQETIEERAEREAREYTQKYCPTPPQNNVITDSIVFDKKSRTQIHYGTFVGVIDDSAKIAAAKEEIKRETLTMLRQNASIKTYKDAGFNFELVYRSQKTGHQLLHLRYTAEDLKAKNAE